ncbi:MAG: DUF4738 domain-containing protein [Sphingobacteriaceae bacterium]|nr:DUF4738 domain-containing protein [Sphingobacteriaceae bacterium]
MLEKIRYYLSLVLTSILLYSCIQNKNSNKIQITQPTNKTNTNTILKDTIKLAIESDSNFYKTEIKDQYFPEKYEENTIDTILDSKENLRISITKKTLMNKSVSFSHTSKKSTTSVFHFRDYSSEITVYKSNKILFNRTFNKNDFEQIGDENFLNQAITLNTWVQEYDKQSKIIKIQHVIGVPETCWSYHFTLFIDKDGKFHSELDEIR